ncbi:MAG: hypothetical protein KDD53_09555 [Bdellovibrionales bacterium]|nr:hypothetical protein [Bdellovibrionales bacterium]
MPLKDSDILDLPEAPDFISKPPEYTVSEMIEICEKMLPFWNSVRYSKPDPESIGEPFSLEGLEFSEKKSCGAERDEKSDL